jgi:hypothetical protein
MRPGARRAAPPRQSPALRPDQRRREAPRLIAQRPGLRPRSADNYRWLLKKHISPRLGGVPVGKLSTPMIREWRSTLLDPGSGRVGHDGGEGVSLASCRSDDGG